MYIHTLYNIYNAHEIYNDIHFIILENTYLNTFVYSFSFKNVIAGIPATSAQSDRFSISTSTVAAGNIRVIYFHPNHIHIRRINLVRGYGVAEYTGIYLARYITESRMIDGSNFCASRAQTRNVNVFQV